MAKVASWANGVQSSRIGRSSTGILAIFLKLIAEGYSGAEIARRLAISSKTVDA